MNSRPKSNALFGAPSMACAARWMIRCFFWSALVLTALFCRTHSAQTEKAPSISRSRNKSAKGRTVDSARQNLRSAPPHHILFPDSSVFALPSFAVNLLLTRFPFIISQLVITSLSTDFTDYTDSKRSVDILADTSSPAAVS